jgi:hypothetical protein
MSRCQRGSVGVVPHRHNALVPSAPGSGHGALIGLLVPVVAVAALDVLERDASLAHERDQLAPEIVVLDRLLIGVRQPLRSHFSCQRCRKQFTT